MIKKYFLFRYILKDTSSVQRKKKKRITEYNNLKKLKDKKKKNLIRR